MTREEARTILRETSVTPYIHQDIIGKYFDAMQMAIDALKQQEIVHCKDCKHCYVDGENVRFNVCELDHNKVQSDDWFCADGERNEGG